MAAIPKARIGVIVHSTWGHQNTLADAVSAGVSSVAGAELVRYQFQETLPQEVLTKMYAAPKTDLPEITPDELANLDGFIFCFGTRYGRAPAQVSTFMDATGGHWAKGSYVGKFAGVVTSSGSNHGGTETTVLTTLPFFAHHGIIYVPIGFVKKELSITDKVTGGSAWGASTIAGGQGQLPVLEEDKAVAYDQGERFATLVSTYIRGKHAASRPADVTGPISASHDLASLNLGAPITTPTEGYVVDSAQTTTASTPAAKDETIHTPPPATTADVAVPATTTTAAATTTPGPAGDIPVNTNNVAAAPTSSNEKVVVPAPAAAPKQPKKKGGMFSMCCGGNGDDLKA